MKIGIDIDDTLAMTSDYLLPLALKYDKDVLHKNGVVKPEIDFPRCFDWTNEELSYFLKNIFEKEVLHIPVMENAKREIIKLRDAGNEIIIISSRNKMQLSDPYLLTEKWLELNDIVVDKLIVEAKYKGPIIEEEGIQLLIDDSVGQCTFVADNNKIPVILFPKETNNIENKGVIRVNGWDEIYDQVTALNKRKVV